MSETIAATKYGKVEGFLKDGVYQWRGIPYAAPPKRFQAPEECEPWEGVRDAKNFGPVCIQSKGKHKKRGEYINTLHFQSEDCLFINVWSKNPSGKAPVVFFIHGGAFYFYGGSITNANALADGDVVVVTMNYRLGAFGGFNFSFLDEKFCPNIQLHDLALALKWVNENIAAFGGDPGNVTLSGQSAGAIAGVGLLNVPSVYPYFHKAILMSSFPAEMFTDKESSMKSAKYFLDKAGIKSKEELLALSSKELHKRMANFCAKEPLFGLMSIKIAVDGEFLPNKPMEGARLGTDAPVPVVFGTADNEADILQKFPIAKSIVKRDFVENRRQSISGVKEIYDSEYRSSRKLRRTLLTDILIKAPTAAYADEHAKRQDTWQYCFCYNSILSRLSGIGAMHAIDVPFFFGDLQKDQLLGYFFKLSNTKKVAAPLRDRFHSDILEFVKTGKCSYPKYSESYSVKRYAGGKRCRSDIIVTGLTTAMQKWIKHFNAPGE